MNMLDHCSGNFTGCQSKTGLYFKTAPFFLGGGGYFCFVLFVCLLLLLFVFVCLFVCFFLSLFVSFFVVVFLFLFWVVPCHHTCHRVSLYTLLLARSVPVQKKKKKKKKLSCVRWKRKGFGYRSFSVQASLVWNNLLLTSDTAVLSHSSELVSLLLPTLSYSNPFTGIVCYT